VEIAKRKCGTGHSELQQLLVWLRELDVKEVVMESTAQYWRPLWTVLEPHLVLHLAHAQSNRAPKGRKSDWADAKRLVKRQVADELFLSYVPQSEQRDWRMITRARHALMADQVHLHNQIEALLEQASLKLSSVISDLLGVSGQRILKALSEGQTDPQALAALADRRLRCGTEVLLDALRGEFRPVHQLLLKQLLERWTTIRQQIEQLDRQAAEKMKPHSAAVKRLIEVPGIGVAAAQVILAEIGPEAVAFASSSNLCSWVGVCPGLNESAGENHSGRCAKGNRYIRAVLCQVAQAAVRTKDCHLQVVFRKLVVRLGYTKAVWAIAHKIAIIIWNILHKGASYIEYGTAVNPKAAQLAIRHHLKALIRLGYPVQIQPPTN
jgi:transposase